MTEINFSGVLLAAGQSKRMGEDKALLLHEGLELWRRQWAVLVQARANPVFLSVRPSQTWVPPGIATVTDLEPGLGPLGGLVAALEKNSASHLMVLAVDLPHLPARWFRSLSALCAPGRGGVGRREGFYEPLAAIYPREVLPLAQSALAARELSLQKLLKKAETAGLLAVHEISADEALWFQNWNEPVDRK